MRFLLVVTIVMIGLPCAYLIPPPKEEIVRHIWKPIPEDPAELNVRWEGTCERFFRVIEVATESDLSRSEVIRRIGKPTARSRNPKTFAPLCEASRFSEYWVYAIDDGVEIVIEFDWLGRSGGFASSGLKEFGRKLFPDAIQL